ncbi:MAG: helix-turn-helix domain-containing protein [Rhizomicrobium sp.]
MSQIRVPDGLQRFGAGRSEPRHRHGGAYAALVLEGGYEECGLHGRIRAECGDVLFHNAFEAHGDAFGRMGAAILNLPLPSATRTAFARCRDAEAILRCAHRDPREAASRLLETAYPVPLSPRDWPDLLVADLWADDARSLSDWAGSHGLSAETLSRGLRRAYGVTPAVLRREIRAQKAWTTIVQEPDPLAAIAADLGFCDQAHMSREVARLTGSPPGEWRRQRVCARTH